MTYKTVLVHCNDKRRVARVTEAAAAVAHRFQAHLIGLSVTPPVAIIPSGMPGAPDAIVIDDHCVAYRKDNAALRAAFEAAAGQARPRTGRRPTPTTQASPTSSCRLLARPIW